MPRINPVDPAKADPKARTLLDGVQKALGVTPNMMKTLAHSPAALGAYLNFGQALGSAGLSAALREQIALAVAGANACEYCASAHTALAGKLGTGADEAARNLRAESANAKTEAALVFARSIVAKRGFVSDEDLSAVRSAGYSDAAIIEIVTVVSLNILTNYINHVAQTTNDFPRVEVGEPVLS